MNASGPPSPVAVQQTTVIQVGSQKSVPGAVLLAFFFGPLGMLYATVPGALVMFVVSLIVVVPTLGLGLIVTLPACAIWAGIAASSHNNRLGVSSQHAALAGQSAAPAGWHPDPDGGGRLRYYDGARWTDHYADNALPETAAGQEGVVEQEEQPPPQLEPGESAEEDEASEAPTTVASTESQQVFCGSCGNSVSATARFCSACGETQQVP